MFLSMVYLLLILFFFFNDTATTEIYTLSLHDALPIYCVTVLPAPAEEKWMAQFGNRSEEQTSELQSRQYLVCRLLLEKKKKTYRRSSVYVLWSTQAGVCSPRPVC